MGKSYIENSLKRFLKRKVKITLGLVVTFMITGAVSFGAEIIGEIPEGFQDKVIIGKEYDIHKGTTLDKTFELTINDGKLQGQKVKATLFGLNGATITNSGILESDGISNSAYTRNPTVYMGNGSTLINDGTINHVTLNSSTLVNRGIITREGNYTDNAHEIRKNIVMIGNNSKLENYGEIIGGYYTIFFHNVKNGELIEKGAKFTIENHGLLKTKGYNVLQGDLNGGTLYLNNTGILTAYSNLFGVGNGSFIIENSGFISQKTEDVGLILTTTSNTDSVNNYGIIDVGMLRSYKKDNGEAEFKNYGYLKIRNGIHEVNTDKAKLENNGILVMNTLPNNVKDNIVSKGAILNKKDLSLLNGGDGKNGDNTVKDISDSGYTNEADNMFIKDKSLTLNLKDNTLKGKTITALSQTAGNVILNNDTDKGNKLGDDSLTLDNTTIIGYFEKDGTLLKVDGDLTLANGSLINAMAARDENGNILKDAQNVIAVDVYGKLTYDKTSHIYGTIKGGKESQITLNGSETVNNKLNANELNEVFSTSGTINLDKGNWTKGTGSIALKENGKVNINSGKGNLAGYIHNTGIGDTKAVENKVETTLDGMITGKGTLNVNKIKFELGNLEIDSLNDTFTIEGNKEITIEGATTQEDILNKIELSGVFNKKLENGNLVLSLKSAEEIGIYDPAKQKQYEELIKNFKNEKFYELVNTGNIEAIKEQLNVLDKVMELLGTAGVKITRDITGAFTNAVVEFDKKADKGQWLTNAKYIGSDMEYEGTQYINGYDSDLNSMIAMAEYGITENTSLGFALGGGDTKVDLKTLNDKSASFDGKNYYAGVYAKHSVNGFDMTGSLGYTISNLDVKNGGSADSDAVTLAGYIKKDVYVTDSVKFEPNLSFTYDYIMQDKAEMGEGMTIDKGSSHIFEAGAGMNIVKEFALEKGSLKLRTGAKYYLTNIERNEDVTGKFYNADVNLGSPEIDDNRGTVNVGFDYEHNSGFGINGKYEMMWSDSGDDSRITAGISYKF